jgi:hypothetical protein
MRGFRYTLDFHQPTYQELQAPLWKLLQSQFFRFIVPKTRLAMTVSAFELTLVLLDN